VKTKKTNENNALVTLYNEDCVTGAKRHIADESVNLIICDPPFGISESKFKNQYNRKSESVISGYCEAPPDYFEFSKKWIGEAKRVLCNDGSMYIISGWNQLHDVLNSINYHELFVINHIVWKYNFGVYTTKKYVSSHYHILFLKKSSKAKHLFNTTSRFDLCERNEVGGSLQYKDLEDVWTIPKEFQRGKKKNINKLPGALVRKIIEYSSLPGDTVCDFFMGNFTTARVALQLSRNVLGFELNEIAFKEFVSELDTENESLK
jgi:site-specific DNA-methyltransferase (adenine-specific)